MRALSNLFYCWRRRHTAVRCELLQLRRIHSGETTSSPLRAALHDTISGCQYPGCQTPHPPHTTHAGASCSLFSRYSATRPDYLQGSCWKDLKKMINTLCSGALLQACRCLKYLNERSAPASGPFAVGPQLCRLTLLRFPHGPIRQPGHLSQCAAVGTSTITSAAQLPPLPPLPCQAAGSALNAYLQSFQTMTYIHIRAVRHEPSCARSMLLTGMPTCRVSRGTALKPQLTHPDQPRPVPICAPSQRPAAFSSPSSARASSRSWPKGFLHPVPSHCCMARQRLSAL